MSRHSVSRRKKDLKILWKALAYGDQSLEPGELKRFRFLAYVQALRERRANREEAS